MYKHFSSLDQLGDFNATLNSVFESELLEMCSTFDLVISDYGTFGRTSGQFTHVSDAHGTTSWLDHVICSSDMQNNVVSIEILDKSPSSDHLALAVTFDIMCKPVTIDKHTCHSDKVRFVWDNATDTDVAHYKRLTAENFIKLKISDVIHCSNINCDSIEHHNQIDELYMKMCSIMMQCSSSSIPTSKVKTSGDYVVPGFNEYAKELHKEARSCFIEWKSLGKPRAGLCYTDMCQSRLRFKSVLKHCQRNEDSLRANALAKSYMQKDSYSFWKDIKHIDNAKIPLASKINDCVGDTDICKMWQDHYESLLNSVKSLEHKTSVTSTISSIENESIEIRPLDIVNALKSVNKGKACGVDGLAAEHFIYADERIHVILSILFNCFISHGYLPSEFMKTAIVPIIKNKTGDTSDKNNYRPIALVTACSKIFELCILSIIENYICTHDHQFGFKKQHSTDMCIYTVKSVIMYYTRQNSPVYTCFLDASKAFDRISHWTLFKKLIACNTPLLIVRILMFWYQRQSICVKWGKRTSEYFSIINGVRQGGVLSPQLFAIYMNDLSVCLTQCKAGCHLNETVTNHVMYADDICLMAPSAMALQKMLNLCYEFSLSNDIIFNPIKSQCMVFKPNRFKLYCPAVYLNGNIIDYVEKTKYLGYMFTNDKQDDVEMLRQLRLLYMRSNKIIRMFYFCTIDVKLELFRSFCTSFYCCYLWTGYKKSTFNRLRVAFNNAYRRILDLPWRCSASGMYATYGIYNLEAIIRKQTFGFIGRLRKSCNTIVQTLENAWIIRIQLWHTWFEVLYTNR